MAITDEQAISPEELALAARNHGMPLEALRYDITPTGLHYLLIHYDIPLVDAATWRLELGGSVDRSLSVSLDELMARPAVTQAVTMECAGNGRALLSPRPISQPWLLEAVGTGQWTGTALAPLLEEAGVSRDAVDVAFTGLDRGVEGGVEQDYVRGLAIDEARRPDVLLAYALNGRPLPPQHGYPLRLLLPGWYGMAQVKWLRRITVLDEPFTGYQNVRAYRYRRTLDDEEGTPVTRMACRSLMAPPGIPDFLSRRRHLTPGPCTVVGKAWSGWAPIERVEVSVDGGRSWQAADVNRPLGPAAWHPWTYSWSNAEPGDYELCCRASDAAGNSQLDTPDWNVGGYAVNAVQRVAVTVAAARR
jgi:DMSO/TMAO reductase YedYZ molybdopterin-dependent catalytic subunit